MQLIDAIKNVIRPEAKGLWDFHVGPMDEFFDTLGLGGLRYYVDDDKFNENFKEYPILNWLCTDTYVGLWALYWKDEPIGCIVQRARKETPQISWMSTEVAERVRAFLITIIKIEDDNRFDIVEDEDIGEDFAVAYSGQSLTNDGFYEGRPVRALKWYGCYGHGRDYVTVKWGNPKKDHVEVQDGDTTRLIPVAEFRIKFNVKV